MSTQHWSYAFLHLNHRNALNGSEHRERGTFSREVAKRRVAACGWDAVGHVDHKSQQPQESNPTFVSSRDGEAIYLVSYSYDKSNVL